MIETSQCYFLERGNDVRYFGFDETDHVWQTVEEAQDLGHDWYHDESRRICIEAAVWDSISLSRLSVYFFLFALDRIYSLDGCVRYLARYG